MKIKMINFLRKRIGPVFYWLARLYLAVVTFSVNRRECLRESLKHIRYQMRNNLHIHVFDTTILTAKAFEGTKLLTDFLLF